jgi:ribonuclease HII
VQVRQALAANNFLSALGRTKGSLIQVNLTANTDLRSVEEFKRLVVRQQEGAVVRLEDIGQVVLGAEDYDSAVQFSGQTAVFMGIFPLPNANSIDVITRVRAEMDAIRASLPNGLDARVAYDATAYIRNAIREVVKTLSDALLNWWWALLLGAAAVILPAADELEGLEDLTDSKRLSAAARRKLFRRIVSVAVGWSFACIPPSQIDRGGLQAANMAAIREAVLALTPAPDLVMVDYYRVEGLPVPQWSVVHGDAVCRSIAAASILAKVIRDGLMWHWSLLYPQYGFDSNKGYGTEHHLRALASHGPSPCHRSSFHGVLQMGMDWAESDGG